MKSVKEYARLMGKFENLPDEYLPKLRRQLMELEKTEAYQFLKFLMLRKAFGQLSKYEVFTALVGCSELVEKNIDVLTPTEKVQRESHFRGKE